MDNGGGSLCPPAAAAGIEEGRRGARRPSEAVLSLTRRAIPPPSSLASLARNISKRRRRQQQPQQPHHHSDNCVIGTMIAAQYLACVCSIAACLSGSDEVRLQENGRETESAGTPKKTTRSSLSLISRRCLPLFSLPPNKHQPPQINQLAQLLDCVADVLWCSVCGCLLTQQQVELNARDKAGGALAYLAQQGQQGGGAMHAPAQQQIAMGAPAPPPPQYAPQYGAAPGGYPQMQR